MVNFGLNSASILGIFLAVAGAALYFMRSVRPELSRDQDIFFAAVGLLCGFILLFQGWRLDPILQFGQFLLTGTTIFFAFEAIRLRGVATEVAKRSTPIVDDDRPVSRVYREEAELDELEPMEERYPNRRLRGTEEPRSNTRERYEGDVRRPRSRGSSEQLGAAERSRKRRPRPTGRPQDRPVDTWEAELDSRDRDQGRDSWDDKPVRSSRSRPASRPESPDPETASKPRRRRPPQDRPSSPASRDRDETIPTDYVDYQPIDAPEDEKDTPESGRFDY